jgi:predicted DsbA family dithiol-disulfide isomerase
MEDRFGASVDWLPFDLHPEYPADGIPRAELVARYGPDRMKQTAALFERHGLEYAPHPDVVPNSLQALRLTESARAQGLREQFHDRVMDAYWAESRNIGDPEVLLALAADVGVEGAAEVLAGDAYLEDVRRSTAQAHSVGVNGIPAFLLDRRLLVLGAHPKEAFERAFSRLESI